MAVGYWVEAEAVRRLLQAPDLPIGQALLDQRNLAGLGTLYRSETLFLVGVHPETLVGEMASLPQVLRMGRKLMLRGCESVEQVTTGDTRRGRRHWVYGRAGQECWRCGTAIRAAHLGPRGTERVSYWCPSCQPTGRYP